MKTLLLLIIASFQLNAKENIFALPPLDIANELNKSSYVSTKGQALQFAVNTDVKGVFVMSNKSSGGQWEQQKDGSWIWTFEVYAENSLSLDFGLYDFFLPPTAKLSFYDNTGQLAKGPFTDTKNKPHKQLWPGTIIGNAALVELSVSDQYKKHVSFSIKKISRGFRSIYDDVELLPTKMGQQKFWTSSNENISVKSGSCNVDVICDDGDGWRDQIRSVARYTLTRTDGTFLCTGQMINNTANDGKPLFLTADHCGFDSTTDASINIWWNYESNSCRTAGSGASGSPISISSFNDTQSGSTFLSNYAPSDMALLELDDLPNTNHQVFYTGWDKRDVAPSSAVSIHHPSGHAKRISFENNPLSITDYEPQPDGNTTTHYKISDWDIGTTEGGSSGSGLWNSNKLLVGQLHGGTAACGNNNPDYYGRLNVSWDGGGSPNSRLKDWLDPLNSGVETLQGLGECSAMTVTINHTSNSKEIGVAQDFSVNVNGGVAPYDFKWDINADGKTDGTEDSISATYAQAFTNNVKVSIVDADGCTGGINKAVVIQAPEINLLNQGSVPEQVCGNNDSLIDPGERWRVPVSIQNNGFASAQNAYAAFTKNANSSNFEVVASDSFGNTLGNCGKQFIDISSTGTDLELIAVSPDFPATDDGVTSVNLTQPFDFYGQTISALYLSSNGYISIDPNENGSDFDNDCPLPTVPNQGSTQARIIPLHNDLKVQNIFHQHFTSCPRPANPGEDLSCDVFMYNGVEIFNSSAPSFNFEAILYPEIGLWVYQYEGDDISPASTIGLQNNSATDGAHFSCNSSSPIDTQEAVCVYHKNFPESSGGDVSKLYLETPVIALGDMPVSGQHSDFLTFSVAQDAQCGSPIGINMQAAVYESGFNQDNKIVYSGTLGNNGACSVVTNCSPNTSNNISPSTHLWYNSKRSGNGYDMYFLDNKTHSSDPNNNISEPNSLVYVQYTGLPDRSPIWYITGAEGYHQNNQAYNEMTKFTYNGPFLNSTATVSRVGESHTTLIDQNNAIQTRTINGQFSADLLTTFVFVSDPSTANQRTGLWNGQNSNEGGWGQSISTQADTEVVINYIYDSVGQPYWILGAGANQAVEDIDMLYINTFCPHCPKLQSENTTVGSIRINYGAPNTDGHTKTATIENLHIEHPVNQNLIWDRNNMPIRLLTPPVE